MKRIAIALSIVAFAFACQKQETTVQPAPKKPRPKVASAAPPASSAEVGQTMPAYSTEDLDGKPFDLAAERGNVVFINVWATWCNPCRSEIPELQKLHDKYRSRGFKVVGISIEENSIDDVKAFVKEQKIAYPIAYDVEGKIANLLQTTVLPTSVVVDQNGKILWKQVGRVTPNDMAVVETTIDKVLPRSSTLQPGRS